MPSDFTLETIEIEHIRRIRKDGIGYALVILKELKQSLQRDACYGDSPTIVQQGIARKPLTLLALVASRLYPTRFLLSFINVLSAASNELKRHLSFNILEREMRRGFQKLPI